MEIDITTRQNANGIEPIEAGQAAKPRFDAKYSNDFHFFMRLQF